MADLSPWGSNETQFFYDLTPEIILESVEKLGLRCTGRVMPMNSMENRVYEVEVEVEGTEGSLLSRSDRARVVKFYRPGRWTGEQIGEEHQFLLDLRRAEVPVVAPLPFPDGSTLQAVPGLGIFCAVFPKRGGRHPEEMSSADLERVGRLLARLHNVGAQREAPHRLPLSPEVYGDQNLDYLLESGSLPTEIEDDYVDVVEEICTVSEPWFDEAGRQRIHGDCHLGNLLWTDDGPFWVDFDDMVQGPCVQDLWLVVPGRDEESVVRRMALLDAYEELREFDRRSLRLIEPLRALRFVHFSAWIAKRWTDPAFPRRFDFFGTRRYWEEQLADLQEQLSLIREIA